MDEIENSDQKNEKDTSDSNEKRHEWITKYPLVALLLAAVTVLVMIVVYWAIWADSSPSWTGFGAYDEESAGPRAKTLWDWLELLIVPAALAAGAYWLNRSQKETELKIAEKARKEDRDIAEKARAKDREIAEKARATELQIADDRQKQATLEAYYDRMTNLLERGLRESSEGDILRSIARARTLTVVRTLDGIRNGQLFAFLKSSKLMERESPILDLKGVDLGGAILSAAVLSGADLSGANMSGAELRQTNLIGANLGRTNLTVADLNGADLTGANLSGADLRGVNLSRANLSRADLSQSDLRGSNLRGAKIISANLGQANLWGADLNGADLRGTDLGGTNLSRASLILANMSEADLFVADLLGTNLSGANLGQAILSGALNLTTTQLEQAESLQSATMPDGIVLKGEGVDGPTYDEWKTQYLAKQG